MKTQRAKSFILQETKDSNLLYLTKTALKRTSNAIFNMNLTQLNRDGTGKLQVILLSA